MTTSNQTASNQTASNQTASNQTTITIKTQDVLYRAKKLEVKWIWAQNETFGKSKFNSQNNNSGIEFSKVRRYTAGDDPRHIDWNVSARYNRLYVKEFTEERDSDIYVVMDSSASTTFGNGKKSKRDTMLDVCASLVLSITLYDSSKNIGLGMFSEGLETFIAAKKGKQHAMKIIHKMTQHKPQKKHHKTNLAISISQLANKIKRKSTIFIISDYITEPFAKKLRQLNKRHTVMIIDITDRHEIKMPDIGYAYFEDAETGKQILVDTSKSEFQQAYAQMAQHVSSDTKQQASVGRVSYMNITDDEPFNITFNRHVRKMINKTDRKQNHAI